MRKRYKNKLRSCKMCKPHKMGWAHRFTPKEESERKVSDNEINDSKNDRML